MFRVCKSKFSPQETSDTFLFVGAVFLPPHPDIWSPALAGLLDWMSQWVIIYNAHKNYFCSKICMFTAQGLGREKHTFLTHVHRKKHSESSTYTHTWACMRIHTHTHMHAHTCTHTHTHTQSHMHTHTHTCMHTIQFSLKKNCCGHGRLVK